MTRFVGVADRHQIALLPHRLDDYVSDDNPVRIVDVFVDELDLAGLGFAGVMPAATGRPGYHPATLLKLYLYGYLNQVASSRWTCSAKVESSFPEGGGFRWQTGSKPLPPSFVLRRCD